MYPHLLRPISPVLSLSIIRNDRMHVVAPGSSLQSWTNFVRKAFAAKEMHSGLSNPLRSGSNLDFGTAETPFVLECPTLRRLEGRSATSSLVNVLNMNAG